MKKLFIVFMMFLGLSTLYQIDAHAQSDFGHPTFQQIILPPQSKAKLLAGMSSKEVTSALDQLERRIFGWSVKTIVDNQLLTYVGETIFSRANRTNYPLTFKYETSESKMVETSVSSSGTVGLKLSGKYLALSAGLDAAVRIEVGKKERMERVEKNEFSITVYPRTKVTVNVKGEGRLNNGVGKYFFLGIAFKKGTWETIDIINAYYEFYEEKI